MGMHPAKAEQVGIAVFAKAPVAGLVKTRLIPSLGAEGAADLQRRLIERTVATALAAKVGPVSLWCAPNTKHETFASLAAGRPIDLHQQIGGDLGARMLHAFETLTPKFPLLLVGTDCPVLAPAHLAECAAILRRSADAVFLPTEDGGYALVGLCEPVPSLFDEMPWGTDRVMTETRSRAERAALRIAEPILVWDLDEPADYERARLLKLV